MSFYSVAPFIKEFYPEYYSIESYLAKDCFVGPSLLGRLLMGLRDNGKLEYKLPEDALDFIEILKK